MRKIYLSLTEPVQSTLGQVPRALAAAVVVSSLDVLLLIGLVEKLHWQPLPASVVSYLTGGVLQYILCSVWVFPASPGNHAFGFLAFTLLSLVGLGITWLTMYGLHVQGHLNYALAKIIALGFSFTWNFTSRKVFLFRSEPERA